MESQTPNNIKDGVSWHLPELKGDRSEPVLEMRDYKTINENESGTANMQRFIGWYVFFSPPSESSKFIKDMRLVNIFSMPSELSTVNVFHQRLKDEQGELQIRMGDSIPYPFAVDDMRMPQHGPLLEFDHVSCVKQKLTEQEHGPNKDFDLINDAYRSMNANVISGPNTSSTVSNIAIFRQHTPFGNTVLRSAATYGNDAMVKQVVEDAPQLLTIVNNNYDTALHVAARNGRGSTIQLLLNRFWLFVRDKTKGHCQRSILEMMLMVSLTLFRNKQGNTFFHEAFMTSSDNGVAIFEAFKANFIEVGGSDQFENGFKSIVDDLAPFAVNVEGKSLLYLTVEVNCKQVVDQLIDICNRDKLEPQGKSPLLPTLIKKNLGMLETILNKKPDWIRLRNEQGWFPLHFAAFLGYFEGVSFLVQQGLPYTIERDNNGSLPIHLACIKGHVKIVQELLKRCLDPRSLDTPSLDPKEMVNDYGQNLLHVSCAYGNYELVRYLLKHPRLEIMINQKDIKGNTPLHLATIFCHPKLVHALTWDNRVNLSLLNHHNLTALDIAEVSQGRSVSLSKRLTWNALQSVGTPRSSVRFHPNVGTNTTISDTHNRLPTTEQYKDRIDTLIVVSTLIITTSFAAGFTIPGDVDQGIPVLLKRPMFHLFILSLTISVFGAISSTIILMWARLGDLHLAVFALSWAMPLLGVSLTTLSLAFLAGVYLIVSKLSWLAATFLVIGVILILMVVFLYSLLLLPSSSSLPFCRYISYYPFLFFANIAEGKMDANKMDSKAIVPVL